MDHFGFLFVILCLTSFTNIHVVRYLRTANSKHIYRSKDIKHARRKRRSKQYKELMLCCSFKCYNLKHVDEHTVKQGIRAKSGRGIDIYICIKITVVEHLFKGSTFEILTFNEFLTQFE